MDPMADSEYMSLRDFPGIEERLAVAIHEVAGQMRDSYETCPYEFRNPVRNRYGIYRKGSTDPVIFSTVSVFNYGFPYNTGNLVPHGKVPPLGMRPDQIRDKVDWSCQYKLSIASRDERFNGALMTLETLLHDKTDFNMQFTRSRKPFNDPRNNMPIMTFQSPMFMKRTPFLRATARLNYEPHEWVTSSSNDTWVPNTNRPEYGVLSGEQLTVFNDIPGAVNFERGNILWITFIVSWWVGGSDWNVDLRHLDAIAIGAIDSSVSNSGTSDLHQVPVRPTLVSGTLKRKAVPIEPLSDTTSGHHGGINRTATQSTMTSSNDADDEDIVPVGVDSDSGVSGRQAKRSRVTRRSNK